VISSPVSSESFCSSAFHRRVRLEFDPPQSAADGQARGIRLALTTEVLPPPGVVQGNVDLVQRVKARPAVEVPRPAEVDLHHLTGPGRGRRQVRDPLARPTAGTLALGRTSTREDLLDRALGRHHRAKP
jgi:hypothetical protein